MWVENGSETYEHLREKPQWNGTYELDSPAVFLYFDMGVFSIVSISNS
jgi:hypothetical protein